MIYTGSQWIPTGTNSIKEDSMLKFQVTHKSHNVNTKRLLTKIVDEVGTLVSEYVRPRTTLIKTYDYSQLIEYLEMVMDQMVEDKEVTTFDVIGDHRNNNYEDVRAGQINVTVQFRQFNCLNVTTVYFHISKV